MNKYKLVIFDLIDTLAENKGLDIVTAQLEKELGIEAINRLIDNGKIDTIASVNEVIQKFKTFYSLSPAQESLVQQWVEWAKADLYSDTISTLEYLKKKDYIIAIISNSPPTTRNQLAELGIAQYINEAVFSFQVGSRKPDKKIFEYLLAKTKIKASEAVMIGDSIKNDMDGASACGINIILLDRNDSQKYTPKISSLVELQEML